MPQGKLKVKSKLPDGAKSKGKKYSKKAPVAPVIAKRANRPIESKKHKVVQSQKIKKTLSKALNKAMEEELRARAYDGGKKLSKAQEAVAAHHKAQSSSS